MKDIINGWRKVFQIFKKWRELMNLDAHSTSEFSIRSRCKLTKWVFFHQISTGRFTR